MSKLWRIAGIATLVVVLAAGAVGVVALAQEGSDDSDGFNLKDRLQAAIADILGITVERYQSAIEEAEDNVLAEAVDGGWLTQDQADRLAEQLDREPPEGRMAMPFHGMRGFPGMGGESLLSVAADALGVTRAELVEALADDKSIADVAAEKGLDVQTIADAYLQDYKEELADAVADEDITQKQADLMLDRAAEQVADQLEATGAGCRPGKFMGRGGRIGGFERFRRVPGFGLY
jgi:hypothetical protein